MDIPIELALSLGTQLILAQDLEIKLSSIEISGSIPPLLANSSDINSKFVDSSGVLMNNSCVQVEMITNYSSGTIIHVNQF